MSRSKNTIRFSDFSTIPIKLKYTSSYVSASLNAVGITVYSGINGAVNVSGSLGKTTVNYITTRHLYYSNYLTGSNLTTTSSYDNFLQSSAASGSGDWDNRYFPTESNSQIKVISIPRQVYGERISRNGFSMSSSAYQIIDDGNGNLIGTRSKGSQQSTNVAYTINGVKLYLPAYNIDGTGTNTKWSTSGDGGSYSGSFWTNPVYNLLDGRLNSTGLWSALSTSSLAAGILNFNISSSSNTVYYFGIGCDNLASLYLDNNLIISQVYPDGDNYKYWNIYPITISSGSHTVKLVGNNAGTFNAGNPGSMGLEIYNNTYSQISASISSQPTGSQVPSGLNVIYSSKDHLTEGVFSDTSNVHVGNIIYGQGMVIVTNQDYIDIFDLIPPTPPTTTTTTTSTTTSTTTVPTTTTSTTTSTTTVPTTTSTTTSTTTVPTTTTSTTTSTTTVPTTTSTTTSTTTVPTTTSTTTSTTTVPTTTTSTTTSTTTVPTTTTSTTTSTTTVPTTTTSTTTSTTTTPTYYYYTGDYWVDCSGVTASNVIIRSTVSLTNTWTRVTGAYSGYFFLTGIDPGTSYTYESDGTQNASCGY